MIDFWAWGGNYIGFRISNVLYSRTGKPIGYFNNNMLFDFSGKYLADIKNENRLITVKSHKSIRNGCACKPVNSCGRNCCNYVGNVMIAGCEDFQYKE